MDVFVSNVPERVNQKSLESFFRTALKPFGILAFSCEKMRNKTCAHLIIYEHSSALQFLSAHGTPPNVRTNLRSMQPLKCHGNELRLRMDGQRQPHHLLVECLAKENTERKNFQSSKPQGPNSVKALHTFQTLQPLALGNWDYPKGHLTFLSCFHDFRSGTIIFGRRGMVIMQHASAHVEANTRINISYNTVDTITLGTHSDPTITFTLKQAPVFWELRDQESIEQLLLAKMTSISFGGVHQNKQKTNKSRVCGVNSTHSTSVASCLTYRVTLADPAQLRDVKKAIESSPVAPACIPWTTSSRDYSRTFAHEMNILRQSLQDTKQFGDLPFMMQFQLQRLSQNGYLNPRKVLKLLAPLQIMLKEYPEVAIVEALRNVARELPYPGPSTEEACFAIPTLLADIRTKASNFAHAGSVYEYMKRHTHLGMIHRVNVTPAGTYLEGPELETKNRVLRKYPDFADHFIRVTFGDEDFERIQTPFDVSNEAIFRERFYQVLTRGIEISGRLFVFLGFSHSSLRAQSVWFMSPFVQNGSLVHAQNVIADLGTFSKIFSPARCAARIGQAFSDTTESIEITRQAELNIPDIERNGRNFTDGVGTISEDLLHRVWNVFSRARKQRATLLQIRFRGAKGMLALDPSLTGERICLRPSMVKFEGSNDRNLEICGAAYKPMPMYLNRDFVKILEDLGVPAESFIALQTKAVKKLEDIIQGPTNAASFLERSHVSLGARVPYLIRHLGYLGIDFQKDLFLQQVVQLATLVQLRDMKYRARILVDDGVTLYGIADETGYLKEGEVYISTRIPGGNRIDLIGPVIVTRAPARHPGDVQCVNAVKVPNDSPLAKLHNCIVFSQHGTRDLASQLSGGDLDGDVFQIIYDKTLWPLKVAKPADYPRVEPLNIGRKVETDDIIDFFLTFMQTDQLGRICNTHTQIADYKELGTFDPVCINLAEMASVAVDYSKTGIPVDLGKLPRDKVDYVRNCKPDFMAEGPHLIIDKTLSFETQEPYQDDDPDAISDIDPDSRPVHFYESKKALGQLFRAIDEKKFLERVQHRVLARQARHETNPLDILWEHIQKTTMMIQWTHHYDLAYIIREDYDDKLYDTMCQYSPHPKASLTELEVFCGTILGKDGSLPSRRSRDASFDMKDKFERDVAWTIEWITRGDVDPEEEPAGEDDGEYDGFSNVVTGGNNEALERSIACFAVATEGEGRFFPVVGSLKSFRYVAAAVCLREVERFQGLVGRRR